MPLLNEVLFAKFSYQAIRLPFRKIYVLGNEIASVFVATELAAVFFCLATKTDAI